MNKAYIIVTQFTTQSYQSPTDYHTEILMDRDLYTEDYGNVKLLKWIWYHSNNSWDKLKIDPNKWDYS